MMGRIASRMEQAIALENPNQELCGGLSLVCVGDPAQCQAIFDQQIYDTDVHPDTDKTPLAQKVQLSNSGLELYNSFDEVIILQTVHRLKQIEKPTTASDHEYNARADRFLEILHRVRDLTLTAGDYFWLCNLKKSKKTLQEREAFKTAPVLMDYRRATAANPEDNCDYYNRMLCRSLARERKQPVVAFDAIHEGISQTQGLAMEEAHFNGLASRLEISDEARILLTQNINPGVGLMNGTQAVVKKIVYAPGTHPTHDNAACRLPACIVVDVPQYTGPVFFLIRRNVRGYPSSHAPSQTLTIAQSHERSFL